MVDVVTNDFGYSGNIKHINYDTIHPFNNAKYFHPVSWIPSNATQNELELVSTPWP